MKKKKIKQIQKELLDEIIRLLQLQKAAFGSEYDVEDAINDLKIAYSLMFNEDYVDEKKIKKDI